jgi:hypothetical protein
MTQLADSLLQNAIDIHCHCYPEFSLESKTRLEDAETISAAAAAGMRGIVFKSHLWPTMANAYNLRKNAPEGFHVWGGIVLNPSSGGLSVWAVEAAVRQGAAIVWMPTWGSKNDMEKGGFSRFVSSHITSLTNHMPAGITIFDDSGQVKKEVTEILHLAKEMNFVISTGHLSRDESFALARMAKEIGFQKLIFNHPDNRTIGATLPDLKLMAELGAYIEICFLSTLPLEQHKHPREKAELIKGVGPQHCVISTDTFYSWVPPAPELLRMSIACYLELGIKEDDIRTMVQRNPAKLLGLN